jgi:hypothetical protein
MKSKALTLATFAALALTVCACNFSFSTARISDAQLAKEVNDKTEAVNPTTAFDTADPIIHCVVRLANAPDGTKVRARWVAVKAEGVPENEKLVDTDFSTDGSKNIIDFTLKPPPAGLAAGDYKVDIYLNPAADKEEQPAKSLPFTIKSSGAQITSAVLSNSSEGSPQVTSFSTDDEKLYCLVEFRGARVGTRLTAQWFVVQAEGVPAAQEIDSATVVIDDAKQNIATFSLTPPERGLPPGRYRVDLYLDNSSAPVKSLPFAIE